MSLIELPSFLQGIDLEADFYSDDYDLVARVNGHKVIYFANFGSYQGEWLLVSKGDGYYRQERESYVSQETEYFVYKGQFGSCSGCDDLQNTHAYDELTAREALGFAADYEPFLTVPIDTMKNVVEVGKLLEIFPANIRDESGDISYSEAVIDIAIAVKAEEDMDITPEEILNVRNAELQQEALKRYGYEQFVKDTDAKVVNREDDNSLLEIGEIKLVQVKDSSTSRLYLLRVPDGMKTVREAIAWTFDVSWDEYRPLVET